jgi:hypothetical protein
MPDLLIRLRLEIYSHWMETGRAPLASELSTALDQDVDSALDELAAAHTIVFEQGSKQIRMAHPFSAAPTPYAVRSEGISYWANCAWDSLGIAAMLGRDTEAPAVCAASGARRSGNPEWKSSRRRCRPSPRPGTSLLGRYRLHLTQYSRLPVGSGCGRMVRAHGIKTRRQHDTRAMLASFAIMVSTALASRLAAQERAGNRSRFRAGRAKR